MTHRHTLLSQTSCMIDYMCIIICFLMNIFVIIFYCQKLVGGNLQCTLLNIDSDLRRTAKDIIYSNLVYPANSCVFTVFLVLKLVVIIDGKRRFARKFLQI